MMQRNKKGKSERRPSYRVHGLVGKWSQTDLVLFRRPLHLLKRIMKNRIHNSFFVAPPLRHSTFHFLSSRTPLDFLSIMNARPVVHHSAVHCLDGYKKRKISCEKTSTFVLISRERKKSISRSLTD